MYVCMYVCGCVFILCPLAASPNFALLVLARAVSGIGEASFAGLAPTYIDDIAPIKHRTVRKYKRAEISFNIHRHF